MALWLFKEEPENYSYADLERDGRCLWTGVANPQARKYLRSLQVGDRVLFYHTGNEKAVVGEMAVIGEPGPDPESDDAKAVAVEVAPVRRWPKAVTLAAIKADAAFADWELVRQPRLSVMPVPAEIWAALERLAGAGP